jgi:hypothetical protein
VVLDAARETAEVATEEANRAAAVMSRSAKRKKRCSGHRTLDRIVSLSSNRRGLGQQGGGWLGENGVDSSRDGRHAEPIEPGAQLEIQRPQHVR